MRFWRRRPRRVMFRRSHLKILLIGNSGVGKSALMNQYVNNRFSTRYRATIGADFLSKELTVDGRTLTVQVSTEQGEEWSRLHRAEYFETSAKAATNVQEVFEWAVRAVLRNRKTLEPPQPDSVQLETRQPEEAPRERCSC